MERGGGRAGRSGEIGHGGEAAECDGVGGTDGADGADRPDGIDGIDGADGIDASRLPPWAVDAQERSRRTRRRIVVAARALLQRRPFDEIRVEEIAEEAGISVGGFYARFPDKEALLRYLALELSREAKGAFGRALGEELPADAGLPAVVRAYVETLVAEMHRHRTLLRELRRVAGANPVAGPTLAHTIADINRSIHDLFRERAWRVHHAILHPAPREAVECGLFMVNAAAREAVLAGALATYDVEPDRAALVGELTRSLVAYLTAGPSTGARSRSASPSSDPAGPGR